MQNLKQDVNEESIREALVDYGDILTVRLDKINMNFYPVSRIGYVVFR
jgi:hypothetical protein